MQKRLAFAATIVVVFILVFAFAAPALATTTSSRWFGLYVPGSPTDMAPISAAEAALGAQTSVVNFFVADAESFPAPRCANVAATGATPLVTLEFLSIPSGGLASITNGSKDAYLRKFAQDAKAYGQPVWLRPFHEMNGNWYPWGATGANTPAQLIAAYRHVHNIFVAEGATNVKFVWSPNVDFNVSSYYPGDVYVDYVAIDGYNTGAPWRSFAAIFGPTYDVVTAITSKPIFISEIASAEGGSGKAAWITDMFAQIAVNYPRIAGVCWFDADKEHDWRVNSSASSLSALTAGFSSNRFLQIVIPAPVPSSVSIKTNVKSAKRNHTVTVSGTLKPGRSGSKVRVVFSIPKHKGSSRVASTSSSGAWSFRYTPTVRGTYYLRVTWAGENTRRSSSSKTIRLVIK